MSMKSHILAAMNEALTRWEELLAGLDEEQITAPLPPGSWSVKDDIVHLWAWQQRSKARFEAALLDREPVFPRWDDGLDPEDETTTEQINAWIFDTYRGKPWSRVYQDWKEGFQRLLELAEQVPERDLLDPSRYPWLEGHPLAFVLVASYDHHQEHYEKLQARLQELRDYGDGHQ